MRSTFLLLTLTLLPSLTHAKDLRFKMQEIETKLGVGYAVRLVDINDDGKKDIVVVDKTRVLWYENPTWKQHVIIENQTTADNVCIAPGDADGDGKVDFALGAGWANLSSKVPGPLYWIRRGKSLEDKWEVYPIANESSVHRIRFADIDGDGKEELIIAPLLGKGSTKKNNFMDAPIRLQALHVPKNPGTDRWVPEMIDTSLHVMHNFWKIPSGQGKKMDLITASYEGVHRHHRTKDGKWRRSKLGVGNQENPKSNRGSSEIKLGHLDRDNPNQEFIATVEPWHGHQIVVYHPPGKKAVQLWTRQVIEDNLKWGHAVWCVDLNGDGRQELIIGVRDDKSQKPGERRGVRIYQATDENGRKWDRTLVDAGGVAVEDLAAEDLNGDGKVDIVAVGRQTHNVRIYWNETK